MKKLFIILLLSFIANHANAQNAMWIYNSNGTVSTYNIAEIDSLNFTPNMIDMLLYQDGNNNNFSVSEIDSIIFKPAQDIEPSSIYVEFNNNGATVRHEVSSEDFVVNVDGANVSIVNSSVENLSYYLSGTTSDGSFSLESEVAYNIILDNIELTSTTTVPLNLSKNVERNIILANSSSNILTDDTESDGKAVINTKGTTNISGNGTLTINANKKHGISSDNDININGVTLNINHTADESKGLKSDCSISLTDSDVTIVSSGSLTLEELDLGYDPTYCTAIGADLNFEMNGGNLSITLPESNVAGRGIKVDGDIAIFNGNVNIISHSGGDTYTNSDGEIDSYKSSCIKADGNIYFYDGNIILEATGAAGKCVNADGEIHLGKENEENTLVLDMKTTGEKFYESGYGEDADYANPKALSAEGNLYVYGGDINIYTENDGGEGLESKNTVYIIDGYIIIDTYDDAINGKSHIQIDGGTLYANSRGNDAIDSNGTITINNGFVVAAGQQAPEGSFDCDNNTFKITGGTVVGIGGHLSNPTASACTQRSLVYNGITNGTALQIVDADGNELLTYQVPTYSGGPGGGGGWPPGGGGPGGGEGLVLLFTSPDLQEGSITVKQGGTISGGEEFYGYYTGASYSGETTSQNVTISGMVTTFGNGGGWPPF